MEFEHKVVAITGAAGGIGRELCAFFGGHGAAVAALDKSDGVLALADRLRQQRIRIEPAIVDISDAAAVGAAFAAAAAALGPVDILINTAGVTRHPTLEHTTPAGFREDV
ncbi:MAG: SDR family NAD(P)-dependent oxidoreductase, partial [Acidobacteria bacterium]|nr:SDR family NAD(P)-dependent oxidoreductase [Acidobacteriota bacterium]